METDNSIQDYYSGENIDSFFEETGKVHVSKQGTNIKVSVIIPLYNGELLIKRCLDSVFAQRGEFELEVIVIDDGSTDGSVGFIRNYNNEIILLQQSNQGPAAARNKGIEVASGKYLTFLDADDYWLPDFITESISFIQSDKTLVAVNVAQRHINSFIKVQESPNYIINPGYKTYPFVLDDFFVFWSNYKHVCTGSAMIVTEIAKKIGGQRTDLRVTEDWEFWFLISTYGNWGFIPKVLFVSDGGKVTRDIGWLSKMMRRWENAPTVEEWEKRILIRLKMPYTEGFLKSRGIVARNLAYAQLLSNRGELSRMQVHKYGNHFPFDKIAFLMKVGAINKHLWKIVCRFLIYRESHR